MISPLRKLGLRKRRLQIVLPEEIIVNLEPPLEPRSPSKTARGKIKEKAAVAKWTYKVARMRKAPRPSKQENENPTSGLQSRRQMLAVKKVEEGRTLRQVSRKMVMKLRSQGSLMARKS